MNGYAFNKPQKHSICRYKLMLKQGEDRLVCILRSCWPLVIYQAEQHAIRCRNKESQNCKCAELKLPMEVEVN